jgi:hypothetical protein
MNIWFAGPDQQEIVILNLLHFYVCRIIGYFVEST